MIDSTHCIDLCVVLQDRGKLCSILKCQIHIDAYNEAKWPQVKSDSPKYRSAEFRL